MPNLKNKFHILKKSHMVFIGILLLILLAFFLLWFNRSHSLQAEPALIAKVYFDGDYKIADGE